MYLPYSICPFYTQKPFDFFPFPGVEPLPWFTVFYSVPCICSRRNELLTTELFRLHTTTYVRQTLFIHSLYSKEPRSRKRSHLSCLNPKVKTDFGNCCPFSVGILKRRDRPQGTRDTTSSTLRLLFRVRLRPRVSESSRLQWSVTPVGHVRAVVSE